MNSDIRICPILVEQTVPLRHTVLWPDKPESHVRLPEDDWGYHFGAFISTSDAPVAVISLFKEPLPPIPHTEQREGAVDSTNAARFRKFACDPTYQGRGVGTTLLRYVFDAAQEQFGCNVIWCDARLATAGWYERRGMEKFGPVFYKSEVEYIRMKTNLTTLEHK
ncbi:hypothetical protein QCA50_014526 [Cerrena zonata]|uniref:N-acetyltransferase domain-containing protein n=1 Tax=Cerrena zonata TaxID=2478898 RepID=A0AAW0FSP7_9APHY